MSNIGDPFGAHRVLEPAGRLPQSAQRLNNSLPIYSNELLVDVNMLQITSAAFNRMKEECGGDPYQIADLIEKVVSERGKFQDPVTGGGGMLIGRIKEIGSQLLPNIKSSTGERIATLVSLALTPLYLEKVEGVNLDTHQVFVQGYAILFAGGIYVSLPEDIPESLALSLMDVAGAPAKIAASAVLGDTVAVFGAGKAGLLCLYEARRRVKPGGMVICIEADRERCSLVEGLALADHIICADATEPLKVYEKIMEVTGSGLADLTVNCVNVPDTEMSCILATRPVGRVYFFNMATNFAAAALGAEGAGLSTDMLIGNGYTPGHADLVLEIIRQNPDLRSVFEKYYN